MVRLLCGYFTDQSDWNGVWLIRLIFYFYLLWWMDSFEAAGSASIQACQKLLGGRWIKHASPQICHYCSQKKTKKKKKKKKKEKKMQFRCSESFSHDVTVKDKAVFTMGTSGNRRADSENCCYHFSSSVQRCQCLIEYRRNFKAIRNCPFWIDFNWNVTFQSVKRHWNW